MFIKNFSCVMICQDCGAVRQKSAYMSPFPITEIGVEISGQSLNCSSCNGLNIVVKNVECKVLEDYGPFGNLRRGEWECPKGCYKYFYPVMLDRAFNGDIDSEEFFHYAEKYLNIEDLGYPPKCTKCKQRLIYKEGAGGFR